MSKVFNVMNNVVETEEGYEVICRMLEAEVILDCREATYVVINMVPY